ncbi:hypothetical protein COCON_G00197970 [Conger conger]|uniref:Ig-like domain-containing protein n=1 Tax=Conger conger TaxID=82655 RepID=A0A9Q1HQJ0_CONCO|nr:hypothetical protein COCON_G00197970 [Conger conger]
MTSMALLLLLLLPCLYREALGNKCLPEFRGKKHTVTVSSMDSLKISCAFIHCERKLHFKWCKLNESNCMYINKTEYIEKNNDGSGIFYLNFVNISMIDSGDYRCEMSGNLSFKSHPITVIVNAAKDTGNSQTNETRTTTPNGPGKDRENSLDWLLYIYISAGALVLMVIVVVTTCILKSRGSERPRAARRKQDQVQRDLQSAVPLNENGRPHPSLPACPPPSLPDRPRSIRSPHSQRPPSLGATPAPAPAPVPVPGRRKSRTKRTPATAAPPSGGAGMPTAAGGGGVYDNDREEAESPIVYAALNHQVARKGPSQDHTYVPMQDLTEYAAIRLS